MAEHPDLVFDPNLDEHIHTYRVELRRLESTRFVVQRILVPIVACLGVSGNLCNIVVLTRRGMRSSTNRYLTALALFDILYLLLGFTMTWEYYEAISGHPAYVRYRYPIGRPMADTCSNTAVWLTLTFTVERYISIRYPIRSLAWCTPRKTWYVICAVCLAVVLLTFPEFFAYRAVSVVKSVAESRRTKAYNRTDIIIEPTWFGNGDLYRYGYVYVSQVLFTFVPLLSIIVFNGCLICAVVEASRRRKEMIRMPPVVPAARGTGAPTSNGSSAMTGVTWKNMSPGKAGINLLTGETGQKLLTDETGKKLLTGKTGEHMLTGETCANVSARCSKDGLKAGEPSEKLLSGDTIQSAPRKGTAKKDEGKTLLSGGVVRSALSGPAWDCLRTEQDRRNQVEQLHVTVMLIAVVVAFLLCQLPQAIQNLYTSYMSNVMSDAVHVFRLKVSANVLNLLVMINASLNVVLYSAFCQKFRRTFVVMFCTGKRKMSLLLQSNQPQQTNSLGTAGVTNNERNTPAMVWRRFVMSRAAFPFRGERQLQWGVRSGDGLDGRRAAQSKQEVKLRAQSAPCEMHLARYSNVRGVRRESKATEL